MAAEVKELLSRVLSHAKITILTFEFTGDIAVCLEEGLSINLDRIIDLQTAEAKADPGHFLEETNIRGLAFQIRKGNPDLDPLFGPATGQLEKKDNFEWDAMFFTIIHDNLSKTAFIDEVFMEYAATDVTLTALACRVRTATGLLQEGIEKTGLKMKDFKEIQKETGNVIAPSLLRNIAFCGKCFGRYRKEVNCEDDEGIRWAVKIRRMACLFMLAEEVFGEKMVEWDRDVHVEKKEVAERMLKENMEGVRRLANLPKKVSEE
jgi:hypothetical protein